ncbi:MAG: glycosyl hydrolase-related protein [Chloroflexota bacterium]|nr:glycosyl hydrolase-related protein [Chloroflexota bacterium]
MTTTQLPHSLEPGASQVAASNGDSPPQYTGIVVNHTHWDREWYMPFQRYRVLLVDVVDMVLDTLATNPGFEGFMLDGQTVVVEDYLEVRPDRREELERHIRNGRISVGPWYVLPDEFLPSPESLIRNLLLGREQMRQLGAPPGLVGYLPDTFGHPSQLPQILARFDLNSTVVFRGVQYDRSEFIWEAPDGTQLLTVYLPGGYYNAMELARAPRFWLEERMAPMIEQATRFATTRNVLLMNGCDHFLPQPATQDIIEEANRRQQTVRLRQGTLEEYVALVMEAEPELEVKSGEWRHNRPSRITPGVLSARMYLKQADFRASTLLERGAEPLQAMSWLFGGKHDTGLMSTAWRYVLQNHPHDSICGCSIDAVHRDCEARFRWAEEIAGDLVERGAAALSRRVAAPHGPGLVVFNTLARPRTATAHMRLHFLEPGTKFYLTDAAGSRIPHQEVSRRPMKVEWDPQRESFFCSGRVYPATVVTAVDRNAIGGRWQRWVGEEVEVLFPANLPAGGYTTVRVLPQEDGALDDAGNTSTSPGVTSGPNWLENDLVRVEVAENGSFTLTDRETGETYGPLNVFLSEADRGDEYSFCPAEADEPVDSLGCTASIALVEEGPLRATLEVNLSMRLPAALTADRTRRVDDRVEVPIRSRVSLTAGERRVEVCTDVENTARDHRLRATFMTGVRTEHADAQGQFHVMRRPVGLPEEERARVPRFDEEQEVSYHPQRAFVDVSDERRGFALLNQGLPEYEAVPSDEGVWLGVTLLRCVGWLSREDLSTRYKHAGPPLETPEAQCLGRYTFEYAVVTHSGDWLQGGIPSEAESYVSPIFSAPVQAKGPGGRQMGVLVVADNAVDAVGESGEVTPDDGSTTQLIEEAPALSIPNPVSSNAVAQWPLETSFYSLSPAELLFSACKRSEDGKSLILRVYNTAPYPVDATLQLAVPGTVRLANLAEREVSDPLVPWEGASSGSRTFRFAANQYEILTLSIRSEQQP